MSESGESVYIVTGASRGIGRAVASELATRGVQTLAVARSMPLLESLASECNGQVKYVAADLATPAGIEQVVAKIDDRQEIAGIVHAAGSLIPLEPFQAIDANELVQHFRIHVGAPIDLYQALAKSHAIRRMLFIDSYSATTGRLGWAAYSIIKSAAQMAARCASQELGDTNTIRVFPGAVNTRVVDAVLTTETETAKNFAGMRQRAEFAEPSEAAAFITAILVDVCDDLLRSRESWDYNNSEDRTLAG